MSPDRRTSTDRTGPRARLPSLRWYLGVARLRGARLLLLPGRELAHRACALLAAAALLVGCCAQLVRELRPADVVDGLPVSQAVFNIWIYLAVMLVSALVSYALRPKVKPPEQAKPQTPVAVDGKGIRRTYGEVWHTDPQVLAYKQLGTQKIKAKGGKK